MPAAFFARFFVANYCPLVFMEEGGRNRVPEKLPQSEREPLFAACDRALRRTILHFQPRHVLGVGTFAARKVRDLAGDLDLALGSVPHPSPASPLANRGWAALMDRALAEHGIRL
jgi:single-strand selective monofunctional uracil DNA glycosylase